MDYLAYRSFDKDSNTVKWTTPSNHTQRGKWTTTGKPVTIFLNSYKVTAYPKSKSIYVYDVTIGNGAEKRGLMNKIWYSNTTKEKLQGYVWLWDGNKLAWSTKQIKEVEFKFMVDLDKEPGARPARAGQEGKNMFRVVLRPVGAVDTDPVAQYLAGKQEHTNAVIQAQGVFDHILRETPSQRFINHKQSFFMRTGQRTPLGGGIEALKGVYQSIRAAQGGNLTINVDVSNGVFWTKQTILSAAFNLANVKSGSQLADKYTPKQGARESLAYRDLKSRLRRMKFTVQHRGSPHMTKVFLIEGFTAYDETALSYKFEWQPNPTTPKAIISVKDYYLRKYQISLQYPNLPLVKAGRSGMFPMELATLVENQRYYFKLSPEQTSSMIRFAVTRPPQRKDDIQAGVNMLAWEKDPVLAHFGLKVNPTMTKTEARLLPEPVIEMGARGRIENRLQGKWRIDGKKFLLPNSQPLASWGVVSLCPKNKLPDATIRTFMKTFVEVYAGHGGIIANKNPEMFPGSPDTVLKALEKAYIDVSTAANSRCQILFVIVDAKTTLPYQDVKKWCDTWFGIVSQVVLSSHVSKNRSDYCSNVAMKVNAKLGGTTSKILTPGPARQPATDNGQFPVPSIIIGADVSHGAAGTLQSSTAAITVSLDKYASRYGAVCNVNGVRQEMITKENIFAAMRLVKVWIAKHNIFPEYVYYFRDGVSEGQYQQVLDTEVKCMKEIFKDKFPLWKNPKFIVTIASKRHHIRFFPPQGTGYPEGNPHPGTLVERDVTHPFQQDFYLCSHKAIQGTARPVHYHVILDEVNLNIPKFQEMIFQHCYAYMRSTTPVSLYPAVYYAHLASNRCRAHLQEGNEGKETKPTESSKGSNPADGKLWPVGHRRNDKNVDTTLSKDGMWFI